MLTTRGALRIRSGVIGLATIGLVCGVAGARAQTASPLSQAPMMGQGFTPSTVAPPAVAAPLAPVAPPSVPQAQESFAQSSCETDFIDLQKRRTSAIAALNKLTNNGKAKMDPIAACPKLRTLVGVEADVRAYMTKNKEWCGFPDEAMDQMKAATEKDADLANKACALAIQVKKMQQQQAAGAAQQQPRLPTGPL